MQGLSVDADPAALVRPNGSSSISEHRLLLSVFGNMSIAFRGNDLKITNRKSSGLLALLALSDNVRETRERLIGILWSESEERKARASLRQALAELRQIFLSLSFYG